MGNTIKIKDLEITFQPINNQWGVNIKSGNFMLNEVDTKLCVALIEVLRKYSPEIMNNGELY